MAKKKYKHNPKQDHLIRNVIVGGGVVIIGAWVIGSFVKPQPVPNCNNPICAIENGAIGFVNAIKTGVDDIGIALAGIGGYELVNKLKGGKGGGSTPASGSPTTINYNITPSEATLQSLGLANTTPTINYPPENQPATIYSNSTSFVGSIGNFLNQDIWQPINSADQSLSNWLYGLGGQIQNYYNNQGTVGGTLAGAGTVGQTAAFAFGG